jgi:hypothetical protein
MSESRTLNPFKKQVKNVKLLFFLTNAARYPTEHCLCDVSQSSPDFAEKTVNLITVSYVTGSWVSVVSVVWMYPILRQ